MSRLSPAKQHARGLADIRQGLRLVTRGEKFVREAVKAGFGVVVRAKTKSGAGGDMAERRDAGAGQ